MSRTKRIDETLKRVWDNLAECSDQRALEHLPHRSPTQHPPLIEAVRLLTAAVESFVEETRGRLAALERKRKGRKGA